MSPKAKQCTLTLPDRVQVAVRLHESSGYDPQNELENLMASRPERNPIVMERLQQLIHKYNHFAKKFKAAAGTDAPVFSMILSSSDGRLNTIAASDILHLPAQLYTASNLLMQAY